MLFERCNVHVYILFADIFDLEVEGFFQSCTSFNKNRGSILMCCLLPLFIWSTHCARPHTSILSVFLKQLYAMRPALTITDYWEQSRKENKRMHTPILGMDFAFVRRNANPV